MRRFSSIEENAEINIMPLMNIVMLLIPLLILGIQLIKIGTIHVETPPLRDSNLTKPVPDPKHSLQLTVSVSHRGLTLMTRGGRLGENCQLLPQTVGKQAHTGPTFKKQGQQHNLIAFQGCLEKLKKLYPREQQLILVAQPEVRYQTIVEIMDSSRNTRQKQPLFPKVLVSPGVL